MLASIYFLKIIIFILSGIFVNLKKKVKKKNIQKKKRKHKWFNYKFLIAIYTCMYKHLVRVFVFFSLNNIWLIFFLLTGFLFFYSCFYFFCFYYLNLKIIFEFFFSNLKKIIENFFSLFFFVSLKRNNTANIQ